MYLFVYLLNEVYLSTEIAELNEIIISCINLYSFVVEQIYVSSVVELSSKVTTRSHYDDAILQ